MTLDDNDDDGTGDGMFSRGMGLMGGCLGDEHALGDLLGDENGGVESPGVRGADDDER